MSRFEPSQPSPFAKFFTWLLLCAIAWTSVLSGYSSGSLRVADDLSTKITKDHEVAGGGWQGGDSGFAYDDYEDAAFAHLSGGSEQAIEAVTYTYDDQCEHARLRAMGETLHPCCNGDSCRLSSEFTVVSLQSFAAVSVNGGSSCDYDESRGLLERKVHVGDFEMSFYSYDGLGSVRGLTDAIGTSLGQYRYDSYGLLIENTVSVANPYLFAGERFDNDLGLYYLRAMYLDVETGKFWS
ncbi:MAG: hypothetical protein L3J39_17745, partial [Verrucomicrobiales bacterium]|nr:hypothetical protein [Verrucomicrobiales bacterium]